MSADEIRARAEALLEATRRLEGELATGDMELLLLATGERERAFEALRELVGEQPPEFLRGTFQEIRERDARMIEAARAGQDALRQERERIGQARDAARAVRGSDEPRFLQVRA